MEAQNNIVGWFEVPVSNMERAIRFYEAVFRLKLDRHKMGSLDMAWFPGNMTGMGTAGSLVFHKNFYKPSADGVLVYFSSQTGDLNEDLSRVKSAGGKVDQPRKLITEEIGYMAVFIDTEGNRIALHSRT
jgi:predicted enzyme related to lactoylglutathione lyase